MRRSSWPARRTTTTWSSTRRARSSRRPRSSTASSTPSACATPAAASQSRVRSPNDGRLKRALGVLYAAAPARYQIPEDTLSRDERAGTGRAQNEPVSVGILQSGLELPVEERTGRLVEVAIDAAGGRLQTYTYEVPRGLADVRPGEAVLVEFGKHQALGVVLGWAEARPDTVKPLLERVRSDGPLLPPLTLELAGWISSHFLAPPSAVVRSMLPPRMLERLELVARAASDRRSSWARSMPPGSRASRARFWPVRPWPRLWPAW